jgi:peptide/nickel transport system substrate-binding protein
MGVSLRLHRNFALTAIIIVALLVGAVNFATAQGERVLVVGHAESTDFYDPARGFTGTTGIVNRATYETLVTFPDEGTDTVEPLLATDWSVSEDGIQYTFTLHDGVTFNDGSPLTADDVVFSIKRLQNVDGNPSFLADFITNVEAMDASTVVFTLDGPRASFLSELSNYAFSVSSKAKIDANGGSDADNAVEIDTADAFLDQTSAGSGPYILDGWETSVRTELVRNENYWGEQPYFDRVIIINIPEAATQKTELEAGNIDIALDLSRDQAAELDGVDGITVFRGPSLTTHFLLMNEDPDVGGIVSNPTVQLAIRYALDYEGYKELWGGIAPGSNLAFGMPAGWGEDKNIGRDLDRARELLTEAGYPDGFDITLSYPDFTWQGVDMNVNAQKVQADLAEVGINVSLNVAELGVSLEEYRNGDQGFGYWFWGPDVLVSADFFSFLPGGAVAGARANWLPENAPQEVLDWMDAAKIETDGEARAEIFDQLQAYAQENGPFAPFNQPGIQTAYLSTLEGYIWHPQWAVDVSLLSRAE